MKCIANLSDFILAPIDSSANSHALSIKITSNDDLIWDRGSEVISDPDLHS